MRLFLSVAMSYLVAFPLSVALAGPADQVQVDAKKSVVGKIVKVRAKAKVIEVRMIVKGQRQAQREIQQKTQKQQKGPQKFLFKITGKTEVIGLNASKSDPWQKPKGKQGGRKQDKPSQGKGKDKPDQVVDKKEKGKQDGKQDGKQTPAEVRGLSVGMMVQVFYTDMPAGKPQGKAKGKPQGKKDAGKGQAASDVEPAGKQSGKSDKRPQSGQAKPRKKPLLALKIRVITKGGKSGDTAPVESPPAPSRPAPRASST